MQPLAYVYYAYLSLVGLSFLGLMAINIRRPARSAGYPPMNSYPSCFIIAPCRGVDIGLKENLSSLATQGYPGKYKAVAVVDSEDDLAVPYIRAAGLELLVSDNQGSGSGKVRAIASAIQRNQDTEIYVVADSDVRFPNDWLQKLAAPFSDSKVGVSTAYPLFKPVGGFWSKVKMVWGLVGNGLMESELTRFSWGGSMAFRASLMKGGEVEEFAKSLSDDIAITRLAKSKSMSIAYVPDTHISVDADDNFSKFSEWANRQTALTLLGYGKNFTYGMLFYGASILVFASAIALTAIYGAVGAVLFLPTAVGMAKTYGRVRSRDPLIGLIYIFINFIYVANLVKARSMKRITWRGRSYGLEQ